MKRRAILLLLIIALAMFVGVLERESLLVQDAMLKDPSIYQHLSPCAAIVSQRGAGERWATYCYVPRGN